MAHPIPRRVKVGKKIYHVTVVNAMKQRCLQGRVTYGTCLIEIGRHSNLTGRRYTGAEVRETFWHELVHAILYEMGHRLYSDEKFVDRFGVYLSRAITSARF
jgi:hypothetical protein